MPDENKIIMNERRIPTDNQFLSDKKVNLKVYFKIQQESKRNENETHRYIYEDSLNFSRFATEIGMDRTTFKKGFDHLVAIGYLEKINRCNGNVVYLLNVDSTFYTLVPLRELNILCNTTREHNVTSNVIKIYTIIRSLTEFSETHTCFQSRKLLAERIGLSNKSKNNLDVITECLNKLESMGLIESKMVTELEDGKTKTKRISWCKYRNSHYYQQEQQEEESNPF